MNERTKNYLGWALVLGVLAIAYSAVSYVKTYDESTEPGNFKSFSVSGEGKVALRPDVAEFTFGVVTEGGTNVGTLQEQNTTKVNKAIDFLKGLGVEEKDIKTQNYSLEPRQEFSNCGRYPYATGVETCPPPKIVGYTVRQGVEVKIREEQFDKIGEALSGVVANGANTVSGLNFTVDDRVQAENDARAIAIAEAKRKAEAIAEAGDFALGDLLAIDESGSPWLYDRKYGMGGDMPVSMMESVAAPAPAIEPGSQEIIVNVTLRYEID
ncbi:MAG: SIMPL domain-containing protein [Patescibacteria group bacterium]